MLRITLPTRDDVRPVFILEGKLAGEWVKELIRVTREICPGTNCVFDLEDVFYVDSLGEETLCWLNRLGATFVTETAYGKDLCLRLKLHRVTAAEATDLGPRRQRSGKSPPDAHLPLPPLRRSPS